MHKVRSYFSFSKAGEAANSNGYLKFR